MSVPQALTRGRGAGSKLDYLGVFIQDAERIWESGMPKGTSRFAKNKKIADSTAAVHSFFITSQE
jgi:hypothetical protein